MWLVLFQWSIKTPEKSSIWLLYVSFGLHAHRAEVSRCVQRWQRLGRSSARRPKLLSDLLLTARIDKFVKRSCSLADRSDRGESWHWCTPESKMKADESRNVACLNLTVFWFVLSCLFWVMTAQAEHKTKVITGKWEGQKTLRVWSVPSNLD